MVDLTNFSLVREDFSLFHTVLTQTQNYVHGVETDKKSRSGFSLLNEKLDPPQLKLVETSDPKLPKN